MINLLEVYFFNYFQAPKYIIIIIISIIFSPKRTEISDNETATSESRAILGNSDRRRSLANDHENWISHSADEGRATSGKRASIVATSSRVLSRRKSNFRRFPFSKEGRGRAKEKERESGVNSSEC